MDKILNKFKNNKQLVFSVLGIFVLLVLCIGISFAAYNFASTSGESNGIDSGYISMTYTEPSNEYVVENALPMKDGEAMGLSNYFEFSVTTNAKTNSDDDNGVSIPYEITITESEGNTLTSDQIKMYLTEVEGEKETAISSPSVVANLEPSIYKNVGTKVGFNLHLHRNGNDTITTKYRLRAWVDYDVDVSDWDTTGEFQYKFRVNVNGEVTYQRFSTDQSCFTYEKIDDTEVKIMGYDYDRCGGENIIVPTYIYEYEESFYSEILDISYVDFDTASEMYKEYYFNNNCSGYDDLESCLVAKGTTLANFESQIYSGYYDVEPKIIELQKLIGENYYDHKEDIDEIIDSDYVKSGIVSVILSDKEDAATITHPYLVSRIESFEPTTTVAVNNYKNINKNSNLNNIVKDNNDNIVAIADSDLQINNLLVPEDIIFARSDVFSDYSINRMYDTTGNFPNKCFGFTETVDGYSLNDYFCEGVKNLTLPATYNEKPVTAIENSSHRLSGANLESLYIPDTVISIAEFTFDDNELKYVRLSKNLVSIGQSAFKNNKLVSIDLPETLVSIEEAAFANNELKKVVIPNSITSISNSAFLSNNLSDISLPDTLVSIGESSFSSNKLKKVVIPNTVTSIGNSAFANNMIENVKIPNSITMIDNRVFANNLIRSVEIPDSVTSIGEDAFRYNKIIDLKIPSSVLSMSYYSFGDNLLRNVVLPDSVSVFNTTFFGNNDLKKIVNENGDFSKACFEVSSDGVGVTISRFKCGGFKKLILPSKIDALPVTVIGSQAFLNDGFEEVVIPNTVIKIEGSAFQGGKLTSVVIPDSVTEIGGYAFYNNNIVSVKLSDNITTLSSYVFAENNIKELSVPDSVTLIEKYAFHDNSIKELKLSKKLIEIGIHAFDDNDLRIVTIPSNVTKISSSSFFSNSNLKKIINKTELAFNWKNIINGSGSDSFVTGTVTTTYGDVEIVAE